MRLYACIIDLRALRYARVISFCSVWLSKLRLHFDDVDLHAPSNSSSIDNSTRTDHPHLQPLPFSDRVSYCASTGAPRVSDKKLHRQR